MSPGDAWTRRPASHLAGRRPARMLAITQFATRRAVLALLLALGCGIAPLRDVQAQPDPLPSWNDGAAKRAITDFVARVTTPGGPELVPEPERIATFDNDGTLWAEQPAYFQLFFAMDRTKALAPQHPEWKATQPFKAVLEGDMRTLAAAGEKGVAELVMATHAGMTTEEFAGIVRDWIATAQHPRFGRPYTELVYQPMLELLGYLRANGFKTYIVSGGGVEFMRVFAERVYGIPPEQVVGSTIVTEFRMKDGKPVLLRQPRLDFIDDKEGKPVAINKFIGRRPILAFGNSDGDRQMLQWTAAGAGARLMGLVHHTDADREYAYDRQSSIGRLDKALDEAVAEGWTVVDMKRDWRRVFP
jgi:phosphoglycolate phosphatase-like HAD superfamily hydrolase